jgi:adenylate kinase family enzyme
MVEAIEAARGDVAEPEEIDREKLVVRLPDDLMFEFLRKRLAENDCRNRGYVLDGFPRTFKQAREIFFVKPKKFDENGEEIVEEEEALEEGKEKSWSGYIIRQEIYPVNCILLDAKHDE